MASEKIAFLDACCNGRIEMVVSFLAEGMGVDTKDNTNTTALMWASRKGHHQIARLLLDAGADLNAKDIDDSTALIQASRYGHHEVVELLLNAGADPNAKDKNGNTALIYACVIRKGYKKIVLTLIEAGADVEVKNNTGRTALMWARLKGNTETEIIEMLTNPPLPIALPIAEAVADDGAVSLPPSCQDDATIDSSSEDDSDVEE